MVYNSGQQCQASTATVNSRRFELLHNPHHSIFIVTCSFVVVIQSGSSSVKVNLLPSSRPTLDISRVRCTFVCAKLSPLDIDSQRHKASDTLCWLHFSCDTSVGRRARNHRRQHHLYNEYHTSSSISTSPFSRVANTRDRTPSGSGKCTCVPWTSDIDTYRLHRSQRTAWD